MAKNKADPPPRLHNPMGMLITITFALAAVSWILGSSGVLAAPGIVPLAFFGAGLVLTLIHLVNQSDRRY